MKILLSGSFVSLLVILGWPKSSFGFSIRWYENPNELFGQPNIMLNLSWLSLLSCILFNTWDRKCRPFMGLLNILSPSEYIVECQDFLKSQPTSKRVVSAKPKHPLSHCHSRMIFLVYVNEPINKVANQNNPTSHYCLPYCYIQRLMVSLFFFFRKFSFIYFKIYLFIFGCVRSLLLWAGFL